MHRRDLIRLFAAGVAGLCAQRALPAGLLLPAAPSAAPGLFAAGVAPLQSSPDSESLLPLFPLPLVLFPEIEIVLHIFEERYKLMIRECLLNQLEFGILLMRPDGFETVGCTAAITEILRSSRNGELDILVEGRRRFEISNLNRQKPYLRGEPTFFEDDESDAPVDSLQQQAIEFYDRLVELLRARDPAVKAPAVSRNVGYISYQIMTSVPTDHASQQRLLTLRSERDRLVQVILHLQQLIEILEQRPGAAAPKSRA